VSVPQTPSTEGWPSVRSLTSPACPSSTTPERQASQEQNLIARLIAHKGATTIRSRSGAKPLGLSKRSVFVPVCRFTRNTV
jgi:hypothetical protein